jgi:PAS domain S-box-containing protein
VNTDRETATAGEAAGGRLLDAFIRLSGELNLTLREEELVRLFADVFAELLPGRLVAIRLLDPPGGGLSLVHASGRLVEEGRGRLEPSPEALDCLRRTVARETGPGFGPPFAPAGSYRPVFEGAAAGFDVLLADREQAYGMVNIEYREAGAATEADRVQVVPLAHQLSAALRNARSIAETLFLKDYLEQLLDHANALVVVLDRQGRITRVNRQVERLTGIDRGELLGEPFAALISEPERPRLLPAVLAAVRGDQARGIEVHLPRADGSEPAHVSFNSAAISAPSGGSEAVIFVGQDLTEVRALQKQVIHGEKLATLGQVAAGVAHELNNPLTSITVYGNYLVRRLAGVVEPADQTKLERIVEAAERIQSFTRDLVTYARPSGEEPVLIRLGELVDRALSFCEHIVAEHRADVAVEIAADLAPIYGIRGQLEQVLVNLLTNACHALRPDGGRIEIAARGLDDERIELQVSDDGRGIAPEHLPSVFEPFFTTKDQGEGTGLGLSIVRNILDNHNGAIRVESEPGRGARFVITLYAG